MRRPLGLLILLLAAAPLLAQQQPTEQPPKFQFIPGPKPGGGEVKWTVAPGGVTEGERDEYVILSGGVTIEYQDIKLAADKLTLNQRTKDVVADGNVIVDQGPTRITATQAVYHITHPTRTLPYPPRRHAPRTDSAG